MPKHLPYIWWEYRRDYDSLDEPLFVKACEFIKQNSTQYLGILEKKDSGQPHMHVNFLCNLSESKIRKNLFEPDGRGKMSKSLGPINMTDEDIYRMDKYICKGEQSGYVKDLNPLVHLQSNVKYSDDYIQKCHEDYWETNEKLKKSGSLVLVKSDKKKYKNFVHKNAVELQGKGYKCNSLVDRKIVFDHLMENLGKDAKVFDIGVLGKLMNGVFNVIDPMGSKELWREKYFSEYENRLLG